MGIRKYPIDPGLVPMFTGRAPTLPRTRGVQLPFTEATADANTFVCEFLGGAAANETGVGLGLTGSDLVLTQVGSVPASSGGYRALNGSSQYFTCTAPFVAAWANETEWTYALKFKSLTQAATKLFANFVSSGSTNAIYPRMTRASGTLTMQFGPGYLDYCSIATALPATSSATWLCLWRKDGHMHVGWATQDVLPTGWDSFPQSQRSVVPKTADLSGTWDTLHCVGSSSGYPAFSIGVLVASKIGLAAAPV